MSQSDKELLQKVKWGDRHNDYESIRKQFDGWNSYDSATISKKYPAPIKMSKLLLPEIKSTPSKIIDIGCGTGRSGYPYIEQGHIVDGIDFSEQRLIQALEKGYNNLWRKNLIQDDLDKIRGYSVAISIGVLGEYIPPEFMVPKIVKMLEGKSILSFTSEIEHTDISKIEKQLGELELRLTNLEKDQGYIDKSVGEDYYYIVAKRE